MYFRVNLKTKKPTLCCCFTWTVFIELNFTVTLLSIRKTGMADLSVMLRIQDFKKWGMLVIDVMIWNFMNNMTYSMAHTCLLLLHG